MKLYDIAYLLGNLFMIYMIYQYMHIFYSACRVTFPTELLCYVGYMGIVTLIFFSLRIPMAMLLTNVILLMLLTLLYEDGSLKKSILATTLIYISMMLSEMITATLSSHSFHPTLPYHGQTIFSLASARFISFILLLLIKGCKKIRGNFLLPKSYWISLLVIPVGNTIMLHGVYMSETLSNRFQTLCLGFAFLINILSFYLYDTLSGLMQAQMERRILEEKNRFYEYQVQMMKESLDSLRMYRHDLKNRLTPLYALASANQNEELLVHLKELSEGFTHNREYAHSGNITVDSIINYKLQGAGKKRIQVTTDILIPDRLSIPTFDIAVILGNLLDNALEAAETAEERRIDIRIKYTKGRLIIEIRNSYDGTVLQTEDGIITRKEDKDNHGLGLKSIEATLRKYDGLLQIDNDERFFQAKVLLFSERSGGSITAAAP